MKRFLLAGLCVLLCGAARDARHLHLISSFPAADTTLASTPDTIKLTYNQVADLAVSRIRLLAEGGEGVAVSRPTASADGKTLVSKVNEALRSGSYTIQWSTAGDDGHIQRGTIGFTVRDGG
jgi:copper resistance protein C